MVWRGVTHSIPRSVRHAVALIPPVRVLPSRVAIACYDLARQRWAAAVCFVAYDGVGFAPAAPPLQSGSFVETRLNAALKSVAENRIRSAVSQFDEAVAMEVSTEQSKHHSSASASAGAGGGAALPSGIAHRIKPFNAVLHAVSKAGDVTSLLVCFERLKSGTAAVRSVAGSASAFQCDVFTYSIVLHALSVSGRIDRMFSVHDDMKSDGVKPDIVILNTILHSFANQTAASTANANGAVMATAAAAAFLTNSAATNRAQSPSQVTAAPDSAASASNVPAGRIDTARMLTVFHEMVRSGVRPSIVTINTLLSAFATNGQYERVESLLHELIPAVGSGDVVPNEHTFGILIDASGKSGDLKRMQHWAKVMVDSPYRIRPTSPVVLNIMIGAIARSLRATPHPQTVSNSVDPSHADVTDSGFRAIDRLYREWTRRDVRPSVVTFTTILNACSRARDFRRLTHYYNEMKRANVTPNAITVLAIVTPLAALPLPAAGATGAAGSLPRDLIVAAKRIAATQRNDKTALASAPPASVAELTRVLDQFMSVCSMHVMTDLPIG